MFRFANLLRLTYCGSKLLERNILLELQSYVQYIHMYSLVINERFALNKMFQRNTRVWKVLLCKSESGNCVRVTLIYYIYTIGRRKNFFLAGELTRRAKNSWKRIRGQKSKCIIEFWFSVLLWKTTVNIKMEKQFIKFDLAPHFSKKSNGIF